MELIKVTILSAEVTERKGTFEDDSGKERAYTTRKQKAKLEAGGFGYPYDVRLEEGQTAYPVGEYVMDTASMIQVNKGTANWSKFPALVRATVPAKA
ncbi:MULTISPECIES: single-stranded DNA-binding protein [Stenotrophomonas]|uniref:single-stranded DNA-binding protein n=1 Tax=Stenotrophomonas TaxID=40323 RepID=UPI0007703D3A|nr:MULTISPECIES: single-stranded DNA-binding protein [Stenotrophomonas]AMJ56649.1 single-stranded DNA-binding protein [Stenotrophomonas sp. KCTC 12332]